MNEERLDVLDKVKKLIMLKGTEYMTLEQVANEALTTRKAGRKRKKHEINFLFT